jgi:hypothetical protein
VEEEVGGTDSSSFVFLVPEFQSSEVPEFRSSDGSDGSGGLGVFGFWFLVPEFRSSDCSDGLGGLEVSEFRVSGFKFQRRNAATMKR